MQSNHYDLIFLVKRRKKQQEKSSGRDDDEDTHSAPPAKSTSKSRGGGSSAGTSSTTGSGNNSKKPAAKRKQQARKVNDKGDNSDQDVDLSNIDIDPDEPTYCLCDQVSYGDMIGCDNDLCPIEWFHFNCVQLTHKPKGRWFCPKCRGDKPTVLHLVRIY